VASLNALDADLMKNVVVMKQSEAILADLSNYRISVINAGRHFALVKDADCVGIVTGRLMRIDDLMGLEPQEDADVEKGLIGRYFDEKLEGMTKPTVIILGIAND